MGIRKKTKKYYFSVEGETENWYFTWLQQKINQDLESKYTVSFDCSIQKNPVKRVKSLSIIEKTTIYHISDYESDDPIHVKEFIETMDNMKKAQTLGKKIVYKFGYTNLTFDLWIVLHKSNCNGLVTHRKKYLNPINRAYNKNFENMDEYKKEDNFKNLLNTITIDDVITAINRGKVIMQGNKDNGHKLYSYKKYDYYKENPSLAIHEIIEKILKDCGLI